MKRVTVQLTDTSLRATVLTILRCCGLPLDYISSVPVSSSEATGKPFRPIKWHPSYYAATGQEDPNRKVRKHAPQLTLRYSPLRFVGFIRSQSVDMLVKLKMSVEFDLLSQRPSFIDTVFFGLQAAAARDAHPPVFK